MKRIWKMLLAAVAGAMLCTGCTGMEVHSDIDKTAEDMGRSEGDDLIVVGFSQVGAESDWRNANTEAFKSALTEEEGFYLIYEDAQQKQENQIKALRNFILQEVDYIILNPIVETGWDSVLQEAKDAGIPVIISDRRVKVEDDSLYVCWLGSDFEQEGIHAGEWLNTYLEEQNRENETINIVTLQGTLGSTAQLGRTTGFASVMSEHKNWKMMDMREGDFTQAKGQEVMKDFLEQYPDIDVVVCENDNMAFGAIDAMREAGRSFGTNGDIIVISFDAVKEALQRIIAGEINVVFECNPLSGPKIAELIRKLENGEKIAKENYIEETYFDSSMKLERILPTRAY
ncbi:MAG: ABC transporter substrate-binding protein [Eubacteriales bacterium]|nr:ABC transporter substrate-binding protein [Eubacteriales bacterium]